MMERRKKKKKKKRQAGSNHIRLKKAICSEGPTLSIQMINCRHKHAYMVKRQTQRLSPSQQQKYDDTMMCATAKQINQRSGK
ncbi:hypothetical protein PVMG_04994 [Plasmodium vivax Mauritania I]|uniref:Uncharacterized protein n=1 Tax=Plasmodium vivax Mauritania I TaxID=1035515 RepID=A0A0J9TF80_PLAVI|nr:hypothetical protein PVMG_04994 [Plasmodium vivax Mauritania I]